jgi:hypothetical protein
VIREPGPALVAYLPSVAEGATGMLPVAGDGGRRGLKAHRMTSYSWDGGCPGDTSLAEALNIKIKIVFEIEKLPEIMAQYAFRTSPPE